MASDQNSLGTLLRHLIELLDEDVQRAYDDAGLNYRPRYTPVVRALDALGSASIRALAGRASMTHSAVSQTVAQMHKAGLVELGAGQDGRERIVSATAVLTTMLPRLRQLWAATSRAAAHLDQELSSPLSLVVAEAIQALESRPFGERLRDAEEVAC